MPFSRKLVGKEDKITALYNRGLSDLEIAKWVKVTRQAIQKFRKRKGLKSKPNFNGLNCKLEGKDKLILKMNRQGKSDVEIAEILKVMPSAICIFRKKRNISANKQVNFRHNDDPDFPFDPYDPKALMKTDFGQVLIGTLLGDGFIPSKRHHLRYDHSINQKEYLEYKNKKLKYFTFNTKKVIKPKNNLVKNALPQIVSRTSVLPFFSYLKKKFYNNKKIIPFEYLKELDIRGLVIWFYDDGHINRTISNYDCINMSIATCSFTREEIKKAIDILKAKFKFQRLTITKRNEIFFPKKDTIKFCKMALPYLPQGLKHKTKLIRKIAKL